LLEERKKESKEAKYRWRFWFERSYNILAHDLPWKKIQSIFFLVNLLTFISLRFACRLITCSRVDINTKGDETFVIFFRQKSAPLSLTKDVCRITFWVGSVFFLDFFCFGLIRFRFFGFLLIKSKLNQTGWFF